MIAIFAILVFSAYLAFFFPLEPRKKKEEEKSPKYKAQMKKLWQVAQTAMKERKPFRAEKALLTILKFDEKNAAAYNRLGILYAKGQKYDEAVECFEIAQSLDNNPASIHNAGLIYLETGAYEKAAMAFRQAIDLEGDVSARYIALAKAEEKLGQTKKAIEALENAFELDPKTATLRQILAIYEETGDTEAATATAARVEEQIAREMEAKKRRAMKRVVPKVAMPHHRATAKASTTASSGRNMALKPRTTLRQRTITKTGVVAKSSVKQKDASATKKHTIVRAMPKVMKPHAGRKRI